VTGAATPSGRVGPYIPAAWRVRAALAATPRPTPVSAPRASTPLFSPVVPAEPTPPFGTAAAALTTSETPRSATPWASSVVETPWSVASLAEQVPSDELPWIDAFLAATPAVPMAAVPDDAAHDDDSALATGEPEGTPRATPLGVVAVESTEEWPLDEAAEELHALSAQLQSVVPTAEHNPERLFAESGLLQPLPAWSDDDIVDIMPVARLRTPPSSAPAAVTPPVSATEAAGIHSSPSRGVTPLQTPAINPAVEQWAERERRAAAGELPAGPAPEAGPEAAAHALELLARRVRSGELTIPGYDPKLGDAAALVAALAALLGVRLG
jgi:hypothetical protein